MGHFVKITGMKFTGMKITGMKIAGLIIMAAFGLSGCGGERPQLIRTVAEGTPPPAGEIITEEGKTALPDEVVPRREIRLGLLVPLSGPDAPIGKALMNAATLALFDSRDKRLTLLPQDTRGTADGAAEAMTRLLAQQPDVVIGPLFSHSIAAIKPQARAAGINIIGFSSDHKVAGDGVYLMSFSMEEQIARVIRFASDQGYARYAALIPETPYGARALDIFGASVTGQKRKLIAVEFYPADSSQLVAPVKNITRYTERRRRYTGEKDFLENLGEEDDLAREMLDDLKGRETLGEVDFDALLLPEGGAMLTTLAAWVSYYEIDTGRIKILGTGLWDDNMLFHEPQLLGGWFAAPDHRLSDIFLTRYAEIFGQRAPRLSTLAYDAVALAATLVRQARVPDFSAERLTDENGFAGIEGIFRFTAEGLIERGLAVYEVGPEKFTIIDPAPQSFIDRDMPDPLTNPLLATRPATGQEVRSEAASPAPLLSGDDRPFPYNPVQKDGVNSQNQ